MRLGHSLHRLRDDLLRGSECHLLARVRIRYEVLRPHPHHRARSHRALLPDRRAAGVEASPRQPASLLRHLRAVGRWRRGVADPGQR